LLSLEAATDNSRRTSHTAQSCLLVIVTHGEHWVVCVDELHGIERVPRSAVRDAPVTVAKAKPNLVQGVIDWQEKRVGYLDAELLCVALQKEVL
jgi:chemotaxis signal transduction protein